jgi:chlorobactene lauroyltransferase
MNHKPPATSRQPSSIVHRPSSSRTQPEIPARHIPIAQELLYRAIVLPTVRGAFHRVRAHVDGPVPHPADGPLIVALTHCAWWDAYMLFLISYRLLHSSFQNYIMMEAKQLRAWRFFAWCGAFSIDRSIQGDVDRSIGYIAERLRERQGRCLWIFPQGRIVPPDRRPLSIYPGITRVIRQTGGAMLWPIALRYEFRGNQRPEALIRSGPAHYISAEDSTILLTDEISKRLTATADLLRDDWLTDRIRDYPVLLHGRKRLNDRFDQLLGHASPARSPGSER